jgi:hypothetical protein
VASGDWVKISLTQLFTPKLPILPLMKVEKDEMTIIPLPSSFHHYCSLPSVPPPTSMNPATTTTHKNNNNNNPYERKKNKMNKKIQQSKWSITHSDCSNHPLNKNSAIKMLYKKWMKVRIEEQGPVQNIFSNPATPWLSIPSSLSSSFTNLNGPNNNTINPLSEQIHPKQQHFHESDLGLFCVKTLKMTYW